MSASLKGHRVTQETREKIKRSMLGGNQTSFKKGHKLNSGDKHPRWKGGLSQSFIYKECRKIKKDIIKKQVRCSACSNSKNLFLHHVDKNPRNNKLDNLVVICRSCHNKIHHKKKK